MVHRHDNSDIAYDVSVLVSKSTTETSEEGVVLSDVHDPVGLLLRPIGYDAVADRLR